MKLLPSFTIIYLRDMVQSSDETLANIVKQYTDTIDSCRIIE